MNSDRRNSTSLIRVNCSDELPGGSDRLTKVVQHKYPIPPAFAWSVAMEFVRATQTILFVLLLDCLLCWIFTSDGLVFGFLDPIFFMAGILGIGLLGFDSIEAERE